MRAAAAAEDLEACRLDETGLVTLALNTLRAWRPRQAARQPTPPDPGPQHPQSRSERRRAITHASAALPEQLRVSLTWDHGSEMRDWKTVSVGADIEIDFCDPHAPWQRATNENNNGLLRQYFPKGTDLSLHSAQYVSPSVEKIGPLLVR